MNRQWKFIFLLITCAHLSYQRSTPDSKSYRAAVVEFKPKYLGDSISTFQANTDTYERLIREAAERDVDIIAFPEDGLSSFGMPGRQELEPWTTLIPSPSEKYTPCVDDTIPVSETMKRLSCAARNNQIYVAVNIAEKMPCQESKCPQDGLFYYNSNVAFDRNGTIVSRYRKTNLIGEWAFNVTKKPEVVTFDTDFGVTFGTFICFDILFRDPGITLTRTKGITDIIYPTAWFSETPFLTALQVQSGWSFAEDVNFLASGYHNLESGTGGSGIYLGRQGIANAIMPLSDTFTQLIIADVPKKDKRTNLEPPVDRDHEVPASPPPEVVISARMRQFTHSVQELNLMRDDLSKYSVERLTNNSVEKMLCHNNFCCNFTVEMTKTDPNVNYRLIVYDGTRSFNKVRVAGVRVCGVIQCANDTLESCASAIDTETTFSKLQIETRYNDHRNSIIMPATLNTLVYPLKNWNLLQHPHDHFMDVQMYTNASVKNVASFGLFSRYYVRDDVYAKSSSTTTAITNLITVTAASILGYFV